MYKVIKRDGNITTFDLKKIKHAMKRAFDACHQSYTDEVIDLIALRVTSDFQTKIHNSLIEVEDIQDSVEKVLSETGYAEVAKSYILYRKQRENIRNLNAASVDYQSLVNQYLEDYEEKPKSYSVGGLILSNSGAVTKNYWLQEVYDEEIATAHRNGLIHIHGLDMLTPASTCWSIEQLIRLGLGGVEGKITAGPAKHLNTLCEQMVNFLGILQNEWSGAQVYAHFDTYLAPYVKVDGLSYKAIKQCMQSFVYGINMPTRWGKQSPIIYIGFDRMIPTEMKTKNVLVGNEELNFTYADCQNEMTLLNKAFMEVMLEGDYYHQRFACPVPCYVSNQQSDMLDQKLLFEMAGQYQIPVFMKQSFLGKGTIGEVTLCLSEIAMRCETEKQFFERLDRMTDVSLRVLKTKRLVLDKLMKNGFYPYTQRYLESFDAHLDAVGIDGMNQLCLSVPWVQSPLNTEKAQQFAKQVLFHVNQKLAAADQTIYFGSDFFSKKNCLDVKMSDCEDIFAYLEIYHTLLADTQLKTIVNVPLSQEEISWQTMRTLVERITTNFEIPYFRFVK